MILAGLKFARGYFLYIAANHMTHDFNLYVQFYTLVKSMSFQGIKSLNLNKIELYFELLLSILYKSLGPGR